MEVTNPKLHNGKWWHFSLMPVLCDCVELGPCSLVGGEEISPLEEKEGEGEGETGRVANQAKQRQLLGLLLFHNGEGFSCPKK